MNEKEMFDQAHNLSRAGKKEEAETMLKQMAENGCVAAYEHLAEPLIHSDDESRYAEAFEYAKKAAAGNGARGNNLLGICYLEGKGTPVDAVKALECFAKSAEMGDMKAPRYLGIIYEAGNGVEKDLNKALEYYHMAADRGDITSQFHMGRFYENGIAVEADLEKAVEWYRISAQRGDFIAQPAMDALKRLGR